jgi:AAA domain/DnaB-like helicase N terminal domain
MSAARRKTRNTAEEAPDPFSGPALDAERSILAAMMLSPETALKARGLIEARHFHTTAASMLFNAILAIIARVECPDMIAVSAELEARGELAACGGREALSLLLEYGYSTTEQNLEGHVKLVRERAVRRAARDLARNLSEAVQDVQTPISEALAGTRKQIRTILEDHTGAERKAWMGELRTVADVLDAEFPPIHSIIGNGILTHGSYAIFAGHSGLGKTYLTIQMMHEIIRSGAWFGHKVAPCRVGMLEFEMPWPTMQARMRRLGDGLREVGQGADILCTPKGRWHITENDTRERLIDWIGEREIRLMIIDPLNRVRPPGVNDEMIAAEVLDSVHEIKDRTGACIMFVHHVRKVPTMGRSQSRSNVIALDSIKGPGRYVDDADTVFLIDEVLDGAERLVRFEWAKTRFGERPPYTFLRRLPTGFFEEVDSPSAKRESADETLAGALRAAGTAGLRLAEAAALLQAKPDAARRTLARIGAVSRGSTKDRRYFDPDALAELEPELGACQETDQVPPDGDGGDGPF